MQSVACTLALRNDSSQKCDLSINLDGDDNATWNRFSSDVGGLNLYDDSGTWEYDAATRLLTLWFGRSEADGSGRGISLDRVPANFFRAVTCGSSINGKGNESHNHQELTY